MRRALERAGNRLKGRAGVFRDTLRNVAPMFAARTLGPSLIAAGDLSDAELLDGAFDDLVARYRVWALDAAADAQSVVGGLIGEWRTGYPDAMKATQLRHVDDSVAWFRSAIGGLASDRLFDPVGLDPDSIDELVPTGFVRHVLGVAGGTADITSSGFAYTVVTSDNRGVGGVATGPDVTRAIRDHGGTTEAYRWVYGPARRKAPFMPHLRLDGQVFERFDSPVLTNGSGWPPFAFYIPGDHAHCRCDFEPIILTPAQARSAGLSTGPPPPADWADLFQPTPLTTRSGRNALRYATAKAERVFAPIITGLDQLHGLADDGFAETVVIAGGKAQNKGGHFSPVPARSKPRRLKGESVSDWSARRMAAMNAPRPDPEIRVNDRGDGTGIMSFVHEYGHRTDWVVDADTPAGGRFVSATLHKETPEVRAAFEQFLTAANDDHFKQTLRSFAGQPGYRAYLSDVREVWARAYSQWATRQLGGDAAKSLDAMLDTHLYFQWPDDVFTDTIGPAVENVLRARGLMQ